MQIELLTVAQQTPEVIQQAIDMWNEASATPTDTFLSFMAMLKLILGML